MIVSLRPSHHSRPPPFPLSADCNSTALRTPGGFSFVEILQGSWKPSVLAARSVTISVRRAARDRLFHSSTSALNSASALASSIAPGFPAFATLLLPFWQILLFPSWQNVPVLVTSHIHISFPASVAGVLFLMFYQLPCLFVYLLIHSQYLFSSSPWGVLCFCGGDSALSADNKQAGGQ